jgi:hypothetical protein
VVAHARVTFAGFGAGVTFEASIRSCGEYGGLGPGAHQEHGGARRVSRRALLRGGAVAGAGFAVAQQLHLHAAGAKSHSFGVLSADAKRRAHAIAAAVPAIVRRRQWGANEAIRRGPTAYDATVEKIVIHHTGTHNGVPDWAAQVRQIYDYEIWNGYQDIAYHYLVDPNGAIYEGRWARDYSPNETPDATDALGRVVHGGHAAGHNARTLGIALLGDYTQAHITPACMHSLVALLAWQCARWGIDPKGAGPYVGMHGLEWLPNLCPHGLTTNTLCPGTFVDGALDTVREHTALALAGVPLRQPDPVSPSVEPGYWIVAPDGRSVAFGAIPALPGGAHQLRSPLAGVAGDPDGRGFWAFAGDGGVFAFGDTKFYGSAARLHLREPIVAMDASATGHGYWLAGRDGGVFAFGDAKFHGSVARKHLRAPIVAIARTTTGRGYYLLARDGGVFAFGDARFHGSLARASLQGYPVAIVATTRGYWVAAADGGVFAFGDARFLGGARGRSFSPVVAMAARPRRDGYVLLHADGTAHAFGNAHPHGGAQRVLPEAIGIAHA